MAPALTHCGENCLAALQPAPLSTPTADLACCSRAVHLITHEGTTLTSGRPEQSWHPLLGSKQNFATQGLVKRIMGVPRLIHHANPATAIGAVFTRQGAVCQCALALDATSPRIYRIISGPTRSQGSPSSEDAVAALTEPATP